MTSQVNQAQSGLKRSWGRLTDVDKLCDNLKSAFITEALEFLGTLESESVIVALDNDQAGSEMAYRRLDLLFGIVVVLLLITLQI